jgi:dihydroflavonol-4-reductase
MHRRCRPPIACSAAVIGAAAVREVAKGIVLACDFGRSGARYILGGQNVSLRDLLALIEMECGRTMPKFAISPRVALAMAKLIEWNADYLTGRQPAAIQEGVRLASSAPFDTRTAEQDLGYLAGPVDGPSEKR